mmetsp:Transcript_10336/g.34228  ORF Transcript_10336/g.34228 Transcript_10336/m.34228 type:complete len:263 (+) Transcript_10336:172-960(+)
MRANSTSDLTIQSLRSRIFSIESRTHASKSSPVCNAGSRASKCRRAIKVPVRPTPAEQWQTDLWCSPSAEARRWETCTATCSTFHALAEKGGLPMEEDAGKSSHREYQYSATIRFSALGPTSSNAYLCRPGTCAHDSQPSVRTRTGQHVASLAIRSSNGGQYCSRLSAASEPTLSRSCVRLMMSCEPISQTMDQKCAKVERFGHMVATKAGVPSPRLSMGDALMYSTDRSGSRASTYGPICPPNRLSSLMTVGLYGPRLRSL